MEEQLYKKIEGLEIKINEIYKITQTAKKMFIWSLVVSLVLFFIPLIILMVMLPNLINNMAGMYSGLL